MTNNVVKGKESVDKVMDIRAALRQLFNMQRSQRFVCGFVVGRIWIRLSIPTLMEVFTRIY